MAVILSGCEPGTRANTTSDGVTAARSSLSARTFSAILAFISSTVGSAIFFPAATVFSGSILHPDLLGGLRFNIIGFHVDDLPAIVDLSSKPEKPPAFAGGFSLLRHQPR